MAEDEQDLRRRLDQLSAHVHAQDVLLLALIATHPNPRELLARVRTYSLALEGRYLANPNLPDTDRERATQAFSLWIEALEARIRGES